MIKFVSFFAFASIFAFVGSEIGLKRADFSEKNYSVSHKLYEFESSQDYIFEDEYIVSNNVLSNSQIGNLTISGNISGKSSFRGDEAYGVNGNIAFSYDYNGIYQTTTKTDWNIVADSCTSIDGQTLTGSVAKGALLVQKSYDGDIWIDAVNPIMNYYEDNKFGSKNFYTSAGEDIYKGVYYRVIFAYELGRKVGESGALWWKKDVYEYKRYAEVYSCYVVIDTPSKISFHNLSVEDADLDYEGYSIGLLKKGETLSGGDTTIKGFSIDTFGANYLIGVSKNDGAVTYVTNGFEAKENGRYEITIVSKLGSQFKSVLYVFDGGGDKGFKTYFGNSFIKGERVFRYGDYPTFAKGSCFHVNATSKYVPPLTGKIANLTTGEILNFDGLKKEELNVELSEGRYFGELYSGNGTGGSFYKYTFNFNVIDEPSKPYVNLNNLNSSDKLYDLASKHYEVSYQTTKGGYIFVCFSMDSYDAAYQYAYEIEKRFIEKSNDGFLYYKSIDNPNKKIKYLDNIELTRALNYYAGLNVEVDYFNPLDAFTYNTYNNDLLSCLEDLNISDSIKVFPSREEKDKLISRKPYVNDFEFMSIADYDSSTVTAKCYKNGQIYNIKYGVPIKEQLTLSSRYLITETNKYGRSVNYDVYFVNDNQTTSNWKVSSDGEEYVVAISSASASAGTSVINADSVSLESIANAMDENAIVVIKAPNAYSYEIKCTIAELKEMVLYKKGRYDIDFIDRLGNKYSVAFDVSGKIRYSEAITSKPKARCYTDIYNATHLSKKSMDEEIIYDVSELKAAIDREINGDLYSPSSYANYLACLNVAKEVYKNPNATQSEINAATANLNNAYENLVPTADKTELHALLTKYESTNDALYTSGTFSNLTNVYNAAKAVYLKENPSELEISEAVSKMKEAFALLVRRGDKEVLKEKLDEVSRVKCNLYTPKSISELNDAYKNAYKIYCDADATQEQIDESIRLLDELIKSLVHKADFSSLRYQIEKARSLNKDKYTKVSWDDLFLAYNSALAIYKDRNSSQADVNLATQNLEQAIISLVLSGDSTKLQRVIDNVASIDVRLYDWESVNELNLKYQEAKNAIYSNAEQTVLDKLEIELGKLKNALVVRQDKLMLRNKLEEILAFDQTLNSTQEHNKLVQTYNEALKVFSNLSASSEDVQYSIDKINGTIADIKSNTFTKGVTFEWWHYVLIACGCGVILLVILIILLIRRFKIY